MITIKEIAKLADVSPSTVSIVLNNKAKSRNISDATVSKVLSIAAKNGYRPNVQAVGLRTSPDSEQFRVLVLWTADYRASMMLRFIQSLEKEALNLNHFYEILLRPYNNGRIHEALSDDLIRSCHGIIVCNASKEDMEYLETNTFLRPMVIYNRYSEQYPTVNMIDDEIGIIPANVFISHGKRRPAIITYPSTFPGMDIRINSFYDQCVQSGMSKPHTYTAEATLAGGYSATVQLFNEHPDTDCIFYASDILAIGALHYFNENHISIPKDVEFIAAGNYEDSWSGNCFPSISVVLLPIEEMATECLKALHSLMTYKELKEKTIYLKSHYIARDSSPDMI